MQISGGKMLTSPLMTFSLVIVVIEKLSGGGGDALLDAWEMSIVQTEGERARDFNVREMRCSTFEIAWRSISYI